MIREKIFQKIFRKEAVLEVHMMLHFPEGKRLRYRYIREGLADGKLTPLSDLNKKLKALRKRFEDQGWTEEPGQGRLFKWVSPDDPQYFFCLWVD